MFTQLRTKLAVSTAGLLLIFIGLAVITTARTGAGLFFGLFLYLPGLLAFFAHWAGWFLGYLFPRIERTVPPWIEGNYYSFRSPQSEGRKAVGNYLPRLRAISLSRPLLIAAGTFFVVLAFLGVFLPLLPTTPFLLLAAACYARSSERLNNWLLRNRLFGTAIRDYQAGKGISPRVKALSITLLWITVGFSAAFVVHILALKVILVLIGTGVTIYILTVRTIR
ncbi:YbaN family protein [Chloroflexota bacterium]